MELAHYKCYYYYYYLLLLLNEHGDPHFLFYNFNENNILNNWEKN